MRTNYLLLLSISLFLFGCTTTKSELTLQIENPGITDRDNEMVEVAWEKIQQKLSLAADQTIIITDSEGLQLPYQLVTNGKEKAETLIFPVSLKAGEKSVYRLSIGDPAPFQPLVYGRLVPERKDDFAWENNRTAFRVYGPALKATGEISNGMDFWAKNTESLIIDKWYKNDLSGVASYHVDHGEGLDFYKVGRTLGLGMTAPLHNDTLCLGDNFVSAEILDKGPLRFTFKLTYDPYMAGGHEIKETRIISLDAYSHFNRVTNIFETDSSHLMLATGIVMAQDQPEITFDDNSGIIAYEIPGDDTNGIIYTAAIHPDGFDSVGVLNGHYAGMNSYQPGETYTYYTGGGWSKAGFKSFDDWTAFLKEKKENINQPFTINID
ncbi:MAG: DUF4861 family protein [Proteiniphilum sp.]|nr:DUF4861 family protein [Proteiniphilum sp.]